MSRIGGKKVALSPRHTNVKGNRRNCNYIRPAFEQGFKNEVAKKVMPKEHRRTGTERSVSEFSISELFIAHNVYAKTTKPLSCFQLRN